jgi:transcription-repair coupling factor (superfamily II helicase)
MILPLVGELLARVGQHPAVEECLNALRRAAPQSGRAEPGGAGAGAVVRLAGLTDSAKALVAAYLAAELKHPVLYLTDSTPRAEALLGPLQYFFGALGGAAAGQVALLPAHDVLPYQGRSPHPEICEARAAALGRLAAGQAAVVLAPVSAAQLRTRDAEFYRDLARVIERGADYPLEELLAHLRSVGYEKHETVEMPGQYSVRGGLLDVFSPEAARPVRIELFGDTVESLREFDPNTQRSVQPLERVTLFPLTDFPQTPGLLPAHFAEETPSPTADDSPEAQTESRQAGAFPGWEFRAAIRDPLSGTVFDLARQPVVFLDEPEQIAAAVQKLGARLGEAQKEAEGPLESAAPQQFYLLGDDWQAALARFPRLRLESLPVQRPDAPQHLLATQPTARYHGNVPAFLAEVGGRVRGGEQVLLTTPTIGELERFADLCREFEVPYRLGETEETATMNRLAADASAGTLPAVTLVRVPLAEGVTFPGLKLTLCGNSDLFEALPAQARPKRRPKTASFFSDFSDLKSGDFIVHVDHGIGRFEGLREVETAGALGEFMLLMFADEARLYVPLARLDLVQKYRSLEGAQPQLDKLGGTAWVARKSRVKKTVAEMAEKLLRLYAERKTVAGHAFSADPPWLKEFEDAFEFEETADQLRAIEEVKRDMERPAPMDRLLCGDVGYGKTEVAMRAAFKAIGDGKQVAVLAPTTVLVFQHYETFRQRLAAFPVRVAMLSRFRSEGEQKKTLLELETGKVDVVIGTHRLLSRDVRFHDLGLLVVDEEQRFGVAHKERLKELRKNVDVLTMSATPIPRTLHMSLVGLRDMSVIETPPKDRLAIQTTVAPFSESLVQAAIEEELDREGQVYFVHNRVASIYSLASLLQRLAPRARVVVGHGQMGEKDLERVMMQFVRHEADVLVSTTIIENGLDISRCNTIFINRADRFGLSELYQLRGRVGRSNQRAYAYLLVPPDTGLTPLARRRLAALKEFSDLGAGFRIAALDLELRGAGNLLGGQQHGHINAVGFDLYCHMMERAVGELKGEQAAAPDLRTALNLGLDIRIPGEYMESEGLRLRTYKRIASVTNDAERDEVRRELEDRFGPAPPAVGNLLDYAVLKAECERLQVASVDRRGDQVAVKFHEQTRVAPEQLVKLVRGRPGLRLDPSGVLWVPWKRGQDSITQAVRGVLRQLQP